MKLLRKTCYIRIYLVLKLLISFFVVLLLMYRLYPYIAIKSLFLKKDTKFILYWIPMFNSTTFGFETDKYDLFKNCKYKNCYATHDRRLVPINKFDAIIFHGAEYDASYKIPSIREPHQRYIFANMESPKSSFPVDRDSYASFYNWTMTYRRDSDISMPYGYVIRNKTGYVIPTVKSIKNRTRLVAWISSHCNTPNRRETLFRNMHLFLEAHVYGMCGTYRCPKDDVIYKRPTPDCFSYIVEKYKFYIAFENSHCKDYVTEKLYKTLEYDIVPIVYGDVDYENIAPPHSVIIADKFASVTELVEYIFFLNENITEYLKYFGWKKDYSIERSTQRSACKLCEMLNDPMQPPQVYEDINNWWFGENLKYCKKTSELSNIARPLRLH